MSELSLKSDVDIQTDFSYKKNRTGRKKTFDNSVRYFPKRNKAKEKNIDRYKNTDPFILLEIYRKSYSAPYNDKESIVEAKALLAEIYRFRAITCGEYIDFLGKCYD